MRGRHSFRGGDVGIHELLATLRETPTERALATGRIERLDKRSTLRTGEECFDEGGIIAERGRQAFALALGAETFGNGWEQAQKLDQKWVENRGNLREAPRRVAGCIHECIVPAEFVYDYAAVNIDALGMLAPAKASNG